MNPQPWDAALLSRIAHINLQARRAVAGWQSGVHRSVHRSSNIEFADYQEYAPGDPVRHLDWRVAARTDRLVIRRHEAEARADVLILLDASGDLGTGVHPAKAEASILAAATIAAFVDLQADNVGLEIIGGEGHEADRIPPSRRALGAIMRCLAQVQVAGRADIGAALARHRRNLRPRSICVVISDLMEDPEGWGEAVVLLGKQGVDLRVLHVYDPAEWELRMGAELRLYSPEGGEDQLIDLTVAQREIPKVVDGYLAQVRSYLNRAGAQHHLHSVEAPLFSALRPLLGGRS